MNNIVSLASRRKSTPVLPVIPSPNEEVNNFVIHTLMPWAEDQGIDIESREFKYEAATLMAVLQGMLFRHG